MENDEFKELLAACSAGSETGWGQFMDLFHPLIFGSVRKVYNKNPEDTTQIVYEKLISDNFRLIRRFTGSYEQFILYLKRIAEYIALKALKKGYTLALRELLVETHDELDNASTESIEDNMLDKERWEEIKYAIANLPAKYQTVLDLRLNGISHKQIAKQLNIPLSTSLTWSSRGLKSLKRIVK